MTTRTRVIRLAAAAVIFVCGLAFSESATASDPYCSSGGPGAFSCSIGGQGACSISDCPGGADDCYACCNPNDCRCVQLGCQCEYSC